MFARMCRAVISHLMIRHFFSGIINRIVGLALASLSRAKCNFASLLMGAIAWIYLCFMTIYGCIYLMSTIGL